jgi:hypothetical protein
MSWVLQWQALSRRIGGFLDAAKTFAALLGELRGSADISGRDEQVNRILIPMGRAAFGAVTKFWDDFRDVLPPDATEAMRGYSDQFRSLSPIGPAGLIGVAALLAAMRSELDFRLADMEAATVAVVERGFEHLQRTIVVDEQYRQRWEKAFAEGEVECEKLGAVHLLWHGIWAFKVDAKGERTDLVLGSPIGEPVAERVRASGSRLVLTEWKRVGQGQQLKKEIDQAAKQLRLYSKGSLAGTELQFTRYAVIVSLDRLPMPKDERIGGALLRFINIATTPSPPGKILPVR